VLFQLNVSNLFLPIGCIAIQVNQIGSVTESINAVKLAKKNGWGVMTSHRSGMHVTQHCR
jgi:enolase